MLVTIQLSIFCIPVSYLPRVETGEKNSPTVPHACRKRRLKWVLGAWGYNWVTQSPEDINTETWSSRLGVGRGADDPTPEKVNS
jgi:hypothetical protein